MAAAPGLSSGGRSPCGFESLPGYSNVPVVPMCCLAQRSKNNIIDAKFSPPHHFLLSKTRILCQFLPVVFGPFLTCGLLVHF